ncbi:spermine oxidase-like [Paramacrobiotus metropolitanus]|uniref:spermine oxidase-like n=1 Tax=Paramacrobiotus metropolitanus TaxID=2943436 RepID=UPI0024460513|nr:spermine oxidase-like [Paramacrobiotus metropolitanus]
MQNFPSNLSDEQKLRFLSANNQLKRKSSTENGPQTDHKFRALSQPRIIIIGAGAAGLSCAQRLLDNEFTNIVILEAQDRIGGRIWSEQIDSGHVEFGAQFLHGKNILYDVAEQNKLIKVITPHKKKVIDPVTDHGSGGEFLFDMDIDAKAFPHLEQVFIETYNTINEIVEQCKYDGPHTDDDKLSFGDLVKAKFCHFVSTKHNETDDVKAYRMSIFGWLVRVHRADNACKSLSDLSCSEYAEYAGDLVNTQLSAPMKSILDLCTARVPRKKIMLNKAVEQINFNQENPHPVEVICKDGDVLLADHCIVTASLGFLKKNADTFFSPCLSDEKTDAIAQAGFGTCNKIFLRFDEAFWEDQYGKTDGFQLLYFDDCNENDADLAKLPWYRSIHGFDVCPTAPNTLVGWLGGSEQNRMMETLTDDEVADSCQQLLQKFLRKCTVPRPSKIIRANWSHNPYILGSYSHAAKGQTEHIKAIAEPTWFYRSARGVLEKQIPGLLFAGEATHPTWFSTVPGAMESGQREADRIIVLYTKS